MGKSRTLIANGCIHCGLTIEPTPSVPIKASQHRGHLGITARKAVLRVERAMPLDPYLETGLGISESLFTDISSVEGARSKPIDDRQASSKIIRAMEGAQYCRPFRNVKSKFSEGGLFREGSPIVSGELIII